MVRPVLYISSGSIKLGGILFGSGETAREKYIMDEVKQMRDADKKELFVYYAGVSRRDLGIIRRKIENNVNFDRIYFHQLSPATAANSGSGTLGLLYVREK